MGYALCWSPCFGCKRIFAYNPLHVPSVRVNGEREPVCRNCVELANPERVKNGLEPIVPHREAYEACPEELLP